MAGFRKSGPSKFPYIEGTKPSIRTNQLVVSCGVSAMDCLLGGGIPVGTILLIEEDEFDSYSPYLFKYFLSEGVVNKQDICLATAAHHPSQFLQGKFQELPKPITDEEQNLSSVSSATDEEKLKIAWRYSALSKIENEFEQKTSVSGLVAHNFDLGSTMPEHLLDSSPKHLFYASDLNNKNEAPMKLFLRNLTQTLDSSGSYKAEKEGKKNILRIAVQGIGSPLWGNEPNLPLFLLKLKGLVRDSFSVCMVSVPASILKPHILNRAREISDAGFGLESFVGTNKQTNPLFSDYHGLFHIRKLPRVNTIQCHIPDCFDLAFKLRRKKFSIQKLHLPPDLSELAEGERPSSKSANVVRSIGCSSNVSASKLDF